MKLLPHFLVTTILVSGLAFAWLTRNPDAAVLEAAQEWPLVGSWASRFRQAYLPPDIQPELEADVWDEESAVSPGPIVVGARPVVWLSEGATLHAEPDSEAPIVLQVRAITNVKLLEQRGGWHQVLYHGRAAWTLIDEPEPAGPPLGNAPSPPLPVSPREPSPELVAAARSFLENPARTSRVGPYTFHTDLEDSSLEAGLDALAAQIEEVYVARYGRPVVGSAEGVIVLYQREGSYRGYQRQRPDGGSSASIGHTGSGVVTLFVGDQSSQRVGGVLVHEVVHLLNRRGLGPVLPAWLEEGLADDLAHSTVENGRIDTTRLGGEIVAQDGVFSTFGGWASAAIVRRTYRRGAATDPSGLIAMDRVVFDEPQVQALHYAQSALLVRYLLDEDGHLGSGFRRYLANIAEGGDPGPRALFQALGVSPDQLDEGFWDWLARMRLDPRIEAGRILTP